MLKEAEVWQKERLKKAREWADYLLDYSTI
jgi:hypothetical protein